MTRLSCQSIRAAILLIAISVAMPAFGKCSDNLSPYLNGTESERMSAIIQMHGQGKHAISLLLNELADDRRAEGLLLVNPESSKIIGSLDSSYCGLVSAYLIEVILGRSRLKKDAKHVETQPEGYLFLGAEADNYPYWYGVVTTQDGTPVGKPVGQSDLPNIAVQYRRWWAANKDQDLDQLRTAWAKGERPLSGSRFSWH
jgi:hypothetical protein